MFTLTPSYCTIGSYTIIYLSVSSCLLSCRKIKQQHALCRCFSPDCGQGDKFPPVILLQEQSVTSCLQYVHLLYYETKSRLLNKGSSPCSSAFTPEILATPLTPPAGRVVCVCEKIHAGSLLWSLMWRFETQQVIIPKWDENEYDLSR